MRRLFANLREVHANRFAKWAMVGSLVMLVLGLAIIWWRLLPLVQGEEVVPLHYNIHFGVDWVGPWWRLFVPSGIALVMTLVNALFAAHMWQRERVIAFAFIIASLLVNVFVLLHIVFITALNIAYV